MSKVALYVPLEAKPGKEKEVADFLKSALPLVEAEPGTVTWFAIQEGPSSFAIFDTFNDEAGRNAHLNGKGAAALMRKAAGPSFSFPKAGCGGGDRSPLPLPALRGESVRVRACLCKFRTWMHAVTPL